MSSELSLRNYVSAFKRHKFDKSLRNEIAKYTLTNKRDNYHGLLAIIADWTIIIMGATISQYVRNNIHLPFIWPITYVLVICIIGARQRGLARGLHEATHNCFASNKYLNFFLGTFCSGYVIFQSFRGYQISHVKNHHPYLGTDRDPDYQGLKENGICGIDRTSENVKRYLRSLFLPSASFKYLLYLIKYRIWTKDDDDGETIVRGVYLTMIVAAFIYSGNALILLLYWIIPYFTAHMWIGSFIELMEHYPLIEAASRIDIIIYDKKPILWMALELFPWCT
ncbi:unnamed protein product [Rotaria sp. Silwood2]|nr:unnamed protein product [Rotaria sp. Silwood2]CAF4837315.1 unnamed protein product [Rotaria sp. Silwood2]